MATLTGKGLADFAKSKQGTPYIYGCKGADGAVTQSRVNMLASMYPSVFTPSYLNKIKTRKYVGRVCTDCSGLISWYTGKLLGSSQMYSSAYARLPISKVNDFAVGTVLWKKGHVGVYLGNGLVAEAKGIDYGTIISKVSDTKWTYGLTFNYIDYQIENKITDITYKGSNPYKEPTVLVRKGQKGENVKWLQWELVEAGYSLIIDGDFGNATYNTLRDFQKSAKITVDGICGSGTRKALKCDDSKDSQKTETPVSTSPKKEENPYKEPKILIKSGSKGTGVKWLQWELNQSGANLVVDGIFGNGTLAALKAFQKSHKLEVDGICGAATRKALLSE